jgi:outer membrane receptor for ferrienterochelin and colicins
MNQLIKILIGFLILINSIYTQAQIITGTVFEQENNKKTPLIGANIIWMGTSIGTTTNEKGEFQIEKTADSQEKLIISFIGFKSDTVLITNQKKITSVLSGTKELDAIEVKANSTFISTIAPLNTQTMTVKELQKAACCNLSESFETNATVDVSYSDAVTGAKTIQMLGLDGVYAQMLTENIPSIRGLASSYGLGYIPGPWIQSIDISKGVGSVVNGYESIVGQINVELKKPENTDMLHVNVYANHMGRMEANVNFRHIFNEKWSTLLLTHANTFNQKIDQNKDSFLDIPTSNQQNFVWRMKYQGEHVESMFGIKGLIDVKNGGQLNFNKQNDYLKPTNYGFGVNSNRIEAFAKTGFLFHKPYKSIGTIFNYSVQDNKSFYGLRTYNGIQKTFYSNIIYQSIIGTNDHKFRVGGGVVNDNYNESLNDSVFTRNEWIKGAFGEYSYDTERITVVSGLRIDHHNMFGIIPTPRLHLKYNINKKTTLRVGGGRGFRVCNTIAENSGILVSSRNIIWNETMKPEIAWNYGVSVLRKMLIGDKEGVLVIDFYRTDFKNQIIVDQFLNPQMVVFSNLKGKSFANSFQAEYNYELIEGLKIRLAYKYYDVKASFREKLEEKPFISKHRGLVNLAYTPTKRWEFDFTTSINGPKRLPETSLNPIQFQRETYTPTYALFSAQVTYKFKNLDIYVGGENLGGFTQPNPILDSQNPFGHYFDASMIWAPIFGRMIYSGIRWNIN